MSEKVKWFHSGMAGAPVLSNNWGDMTALLDACLSTGFNLKPVISITRDGTTATASVAAGHGFIVDQVIAVAGCDQPEYNGEFTVTAITSGTVSFTVEGTPATPATTVANITMKTAPLGFDIAFTGPNKRAYRSPNPKSNRPFLRVDNSLPDGYTATWAKFARVTMAEGMSDVDTFVGARAPYDPAAPTKNEIPSGTGGSIFTGWFKWHQARWSGSDSSGDGGAAARSWALIGDDRGFFIAAASGQVGDHRVLYAFSDFDSYKPGDGFASVLFASDRYRTAGEASPSYPWDETNSTASNAPLGKLFLRGYTQLGAPAKAGMLALNDGNSQSISGKSNFIPFPNGPDYSLILHPVYLRETNDGGHLRGVLPGVYWVHQVSPFPHLTVIDSVPGYPGRKFMILTLAYGSEGNVSSFAFDITGPWRQ